MKKHRLAGLFLLAPLTLLTACGGGTPALTFSANWYRNTALQSDIQNTYEMLEYAVTFDSTPQNGFSVNYENGVYKTELREGSVALDSETRNGYILTTELTISVSFTLDGKTSDTYEDFVRTEAHFLSAAEGLKPVYSYRETYTHSPMTNNPNRNVLNPLENCYSEYHFSHEIHYDDALTTAEVVYTDLLHTNAEPKEQSYNIEGKGSFLDNEQIAFALRGLDMSSAASFRTVNAIQERVQSVAFSAIPTETTEPVDFQKCEGVDGEPIQVKEEALPAYLVNLGYSGDYAGQTQTLVFAKMTNANANTYRNVMLRMESPIVYSLGTLRCKLVKAIFTTK